MTTATMAELTARMKRIEAHSDALKMVWLIAKHGGDQWAATQEAWARHPSTRIGEMIEKTAVAAATTTTAGWAAELSYTKFTGELVSLLNANSLLQLRWKRVDFNTRTLRETSSASAAWVAETSPIPVSKMSLATVDLEMTKIGGLVPFTNEVLKVWTTATASAINTSLANVVGRYVDIALLNPNLSAISGERPASLTFGLTPIASPAFTEAGVTAAVKAALQTLVNGGSDLRDCVLIMSPTTALALSLLLTSGGIRAYPGLGARGGELAGVEVVSSLGAASVGSPGPENLVVAADPSRVLLADDGLVGFSATRNAAIQLVDTPVAGAANVVSAFQTETTFLKFVRYLNFEKIDANAVAHFTTSY